MTGTSYAKSNPIFCFPAFTLPIHYDILGGFEEDLWVFTGETARTKFLTKIGQILVVLGAGGQVVQKFQFLLQKAHPCPNPRCLSHFV